MESKITSDINAEKIDDYDNSHDHYPEFEQLVKDHFKLISTNEKLFTTDATGLYEAYLDNLPEEARQQYRCNACKHFIENYGGLVSISEHESLEGEIFPVMWDTDGAPKFFKNSVRAMKDIIYKSRVTGIFVSEVETLGNPISRVQISGTPAVIEWSHLSVTLPKSKVYQGKLRDAHQYQSEKLEDFRLLSNSLSDYPIEIVQQALNILQSETLFNSEKCLGVTKWFMDLHTRCASTKNNRIKENFIWLAVASAPVGYCHIKNTMIGTLLDDINDQLSFESIRARFMEKMDPLRYQRPQAGPTKGNIEQAEKIVEKLGIQTSLVRRFARVEELKKLWTPTEEEDKEQKKEGVFSHLIPKNKIQQPDIDIPEIRMTWRKFLENVIPTAKEIEYFVKSGSANYSAILTAAHDDAPPILQWDSEEKRNPFSWYVYHGGTSHAQWGLSYGFTKVTAIVLQPSMWYGDFTHHGKGLFFILEGAKDSCYEGNGNALFPSLLKSELKEISSVIEAYSHSAKIEGFDEASACGIKLEYGHDQTWNAVLRVTTDIGVTKYLLDRWD